jgi:hypothetical protein
MVQPGLFTLAGFFFSVFPSVLKLQTVLLAMKIPAKLWIHIFRLVAEGTERSSRAILPLMRVCRYWNVCGYRNQLLDW